MKKKKSPSPIIHGKPIYGKANGDRRNGMLQNGTNAAYVVAYGNLNTLIFRLAALFENLKTENMYREGIESNGRSTCHEKQFFAQLCKAAFANRFILRGAPRRLSAGYTIFWELCKLRSRVYRYAAGIPFVVRLRCGVGLRGYASAFETEEK